MTSLRSAALGATLSILATQFAGAQNHPAHMPAPLAAPPSPPGTPYAGLEQRAIKALSDRQLSDFRAGRGMGLALAAELNGYPGPTHVLELADALDLSVDQRTRTEVLFEEMKMEVVPIGERVIAGETTLDGLFAEGRATPAALSVATARIAAAHGQLRAAHLRYHLEMTEVLTPAQITSYATLRGYAVAAGVHEHQP